MKMEGPLTFSRFHPSARLLSRDSPPNCHPLPFFYGQNISNFD
jgi:hypothetical protein